MIATEPARAPRPATPRGAPGLAEAVVLCGGLSRRMGADKAALALGAETLLDRALRVAGEAAPRVLLACGSEPRYGGPGRELVLDRAPGRGPLAGLEAGLAAARSEWLAVLAVDMPRLEAEVLRLLHARAALRGLDACSLATDAGVEPLCAVLRVAACLPAVRASLARGERRATSFHREVRAGALHERELPEALRRRDPARNLNTPGDLAAEREAGR